ncbi:ABC transporter substrate-binding protein [Acetobacteroides hydrogenigenes]|uniref:Iron complex transport system substrate-binding protein n=1 Tax=Acetobacteroides hydrogenigenes TaxID=979970 RepID=A0A4R2EID8_9BACT|nr:ABC transporter substrate-binding protein [Acetobacteroides hydrogenigenes]TCN63929.1 iron complex transport system substrate-binding protein [Acetobacteroides hydrogenigenes]
MNRNLIAFILLAVSLIGVSCNKGGSKRAGMKDGKKVELQDAKGFTITEFDGYKVVEVVNPWKDSVLLHRYILVSREASIPDNLPEGDVVRVPVSKISCLYSVFVGSLELLGQVSTITSVAEERYIENQMVKQGIASGKIKLLGEASAVNVEGLIDSNPDIVLVSPFKDMGYGKMDKAGIPIVEVASYMENSPLARAEWIKFFALFYGKEKQADSIYSALCDRYGKVREIAKGAKVKPSIFADKKFGQVWNMPSGNSYMSSFFRDAGASYLWDDVKQSGVIPLSFEAVYQKAENADYWLVKYNKPQDMTYDDLGKEYDGYKMFKAYKTRKVIHCNTNRISYYEKGVMEPDVILADLVKILHPELLPNHKQVYFQLMK